MTCIHIHKYKCLVFNLYPERVEESIGNPRMISYGKKEKSVGDVTQCDKDNYESIYIIYMQIESNNHKLKRYGCCHMCGLN